MVAIVVRLGVPLTTLAVSPLTKPVMVAVNVGLAWPYTLLVSLAVTVSGAGVTMYVDWTGLLLYPVDVLAAAWESPGNVACSTLV